MARQVIFFSLTKPSVISSALFKYSPLVPKEKISMRETSVKRTSWVALQLALPVPNGHIRSAGLPKGLIKVDFDVHQPIILEAQFYIEKLFLEHEYVKQIHRGVYFIQWIVQEH